jgi:hypothetical protein
MRRSRAPRRERIAFAASEEKGGELARRWSAGPEPRAKPRKALVAGMERSFGARRFGSGEARDQSGPPSAERSNAGSGEGRRRVGPEAVAPGLVGARTDAEVLLDGRDEALDLLLLELAREVSRVRVARVDLLVERRRDPRVEVRADLAAPGRVDLAERSGARLLRGDRKVDGVERSDAGGVADRLEEADIAHVLDRRVPPVERRVPVELLLGVDDDEEDGGDLHATQGRDPETGLNDVVRTSLAPQGCGTASLAGRWPGPRFRWFRGNRSQVGEVPRNGAAPPVPWT